MIKREYSNYWRLAQSTTVEDLIQFLTSKTKLRAVHLRSSKYDSLNRYVWDDASIYEIGLSIRPDSYLSHGTAIFFHNLTEQIPTTVYVNREQSDKPRPETALTQEGIHRALSRKQRRSSYVFTHDSWKVVVVSGKNTARLEVGTIRDPLGRDLPATNLERTLIDAVVRPDYAGGVYKVLEAFRTAEPRISSNVMLATLKKLDYVYPYHQSIGFYMQKAGYARNKWLKFREMGLSFDFYLSHGMTQTEYNSEWRLFVPKGF